MIRRYAISMLIVVLSIANQSGCTSATTKPVRLEPPATPELTPIFSTIHLTPDNINEMEELDFLSSTSPDWVAGIAFNVDVQQILTISKTGLLQRWRLEDNVLLDEMDLGSVGLAAVSFDTQANLVAAGAGRTTLAMQDGYSSDIGGVRVWDTRTGELLLETNPGSDTFHFPVNDVALSLDGQWLGIVDSSSYDLWNTSSGEPVALTAIIDSDESEPVSLTTVAIDPSGTWLALGNDTGEVIVKEREQDSSEHTIWSIGNNEEGSLVALSFDVSRTRLAAVTTQSLIVWDLQSHDTLLKEELSFTAVAGLTFSPDSTLVAVGTLNGWQIWSVNDRRLLVEHEQPALAIAFSPDSRLFAWGDAAGVVHIWGVPDP